MPILFQRGRICTMSPVWRGTHSGGWGSWKQVELHHNRNTLKQKKQNDRSSPMLSSQPVLVTNTENGQIYPVCPLPLHGTVPLPGAYLLSAEKSLPSKCSSRVTSLRSYINSPDPVFCSSSALTCHIQPPLQNSSLVRMSDIYLP